MSKFVIDILSPVTTGSIGGLAGTSDETWAERYLRQLSRTVSEEACRVIRDDAEWVFRRALPLREGEVDFSAWGPTGVRTGIVVGSVQSGKTAHMLAVTAMALDDGIDLVVLLAGTRVALWLQTYERVLRELDGSALEEAWKRDSTRVLVPEPYDVLGGTERADPRRYLRNRRFAVKESILKRIPIIAVVPKEDDHLLALSRFVTDSVPSSVLDERRVPFRVLVLDDEADDASVLDSADGMRITPQYIAALWSGHPGRTTVRHANLVASYIAYTATPQANYLQESHNPLAPRHFHAALRVPGATGAVSQRELTFAEPRGLPRYYCGGNFFYEWKAANGDGLAIFEAFPRREHGESEAEYNARFVTTRNDLIGEALRAYFVAGAMRLLLQRKSFALVPNEAATAEEFLRTLPDPHTMLFHPSALKEKHFAGAEELVAWSRDIDGGHYLKDDSTRYPLELDAAGLEKRLARETKLWERWMLSYQQTATAMGAIDGAPFPATWPFGWDEVQQTLIQEIFPNTKLRVLNSDPRADDRPSFDLQPGPNGLHLRPLDIYTVFIAGNVLSRGLTLEGLCTSLFVRTSSEPAADTQMQMQRWFGYRGPYLPFCRLFVFEDQLQLFSAYHENDSALKTEILRHMDAPDPPFASGVLVLQGESFRATAKVDTRRVPLHPGPTPAIRLVNAPLSAPNEANIEVVAELLGSGELEAVEVPVGSPRGVISKRPQSLIEIADFLDKLRYTKHAPSLEDPLSARWRHLEDLLALPVGTLFRPPSVETGRVAVDPSGCPYSIAAYLRLWNALLNMTSAPGLYPTDRPRTPWAYIDHAEYRKTAPLFFVGVRFGESGPAVNPRLVACGKPILAMQRRLASADRSILETLWGTRGHGGTYFGDQLFDYHYHGSTPLPMLHDGPIWRPRGHPGLLLIHVVRIEALETVAFGLALPHGGPDHIAALRQSAA